MIDKEGRKINYLRISLTDRCNLRCVYCMPEEGIEKKKHDDIIHFDDIIKVIKACAGLGVEKVRFTGGEPLIIKGIEDLIKNTRDINGINDVSISTNGVLLNDKIYELMASGLNRVNISLDTLDKEKYKHITRGGDIEKVMKSIETCLELGIEPVKINAVLIRGFNDDEVKDFIEFAMHKPVHIRFIELMPIGEGVDFFEKSFISSNEILKRFPELKPKGQEQFSTAKMYGVDGAKGMIGFINPLSCKFCDECNRIRLTAQGGIKPCLHSEEEFDICRSLGNEEQLKERIENIIFNKPAEHGMGSGKKSESKRLMCQIGG